MDLLKNNFDNENFSCMGLDLSYSGTGLVILDIDGKIIKQEEISTKKDPNNLYDIESRMVFIFDKIKKIIDDYNITMTYIEDISYGSTGDGSTQLAGLNYFIRVNLLNLNMPFYMVTPSQLKKYITGNGQAKKELMLKEVYKRWGEDFNSDNICDAYSLSRFALDNFKKGIFELVRKKKEPKGKKKFKLVK